MLTIKKNNEEPIIQVKNLDKMSRFLITGKTELEGWILSHSQPDEEKTDDEDDGEGDVAGGSHEHGVERPGGAAEPGPGESGPGGGPGSGND